MMSDIPLCVGVLKPCASIRNALLAVCLAWYHIMSSLSKEIFVQCR